MSNRLPNDEWLHLAKGTAVGTQRRSRHRQEGRENLVVGNEPDKWWAYCQSCRRGAVEEKTHVKVGGQAPSMSTDMSLPADARNINLLPHHQRDALTLQLAKKHMDWQYFRETVVEWSESRQRLLVHTPSGVMGRDTSERSAQKWLTYNRQHYLAPVVNSKNILLVEDTYSYYKTAWVCRQHGIDAAVICTLGTSIHTSLFLWLLRYSRRVWSFYDGDAPGWRGALNNARRLRGAGICGGGDALQTCAPVDMDPKDMTINAITAHVVNLLAT